MLISDLTYMESATDDVVGAGFSSNKKIRANINTHLNFRSNSDLRSRFYKQGRIYVNSYVQGNSSTLAFDNESLGYNSTTEGSFTQLAVAGGGSHQSGSFTAAANNY